MAATMEYLKERIACGYCMEQGDQLVDPRSLPCQHIHCYPCLLGDFDTNRIVRCGKCKAVFDITLARLPHAMERQETLQLCDVCAEKGTTNQPATTYCTDCKKKVCSEHLKLHEGFFPLHKTLLNIEECQQNVRTYEVRSCAKHDDQPIVLACSSCYRILCVDCMDGTKECVDGLAHQAVSLKELIKLLKVKKDEVKTEAQVKEGELSALLKRSTKVLSDYERKTEELIERLHRTRDKQLSDLGNKYDGLERELLESRARSKQQLIDFMEQEIGVRMTEINTLVLLQDARFKDAHQADIAESFAATANEIKRFIDEDLPSFDLTNQRTLSTQAEMRDIELKMVDDADLPVSRVPPPTSLQLKKVINTAGECYSVCHYKGFTYVGGGGSTVYKMDESDSSITPFISIGEVKWINGLCVYNDKLYILAHPRNINVIDLNGKVLSSWDHPDESTNINKLTVTGEKVVVPDRSSKRLTVYSLDGQIIKHIACLQDGKWSAIALCAPDSESVVVSSLATSTVFRVNIETGEVIWTSTAVTRPCGIASYTKEYILVAPLESGHVEIHILHADTGDHLQKLVDKQRMSSVVLDLSVTGDTLRVPRREQKELLSYQLICK